MIDLRAAMRSIRLGYNIIRDNQGKPNDAKQGKTLHQSIHLVTGYVHVECTVTKFELVLHYIIVINE